MNIFLNNMKARKFRYFSCDFETTVYNGQEDTEVWAAAIVELFSEDVTVYNNLDDLYNHLVNIPGNVVAYFHNLKFDGSFILPYLMNKGRMRPAVEVLNSETGAVRFLEPKEMRNNQYTYSISSMGQWYRITIKVKNKFIEIRDSMKLLPFSVKRIGDSFKTKHRKLEMEYEGERKPYGVITQEEEEYIKNDVLVVKEALEIMYQDGHSRLTIGSCCLAEYKKIIGDKIYKEYYPNLHNYPSVIPDMNAADYIRQSYRGGWCYLVKGKEQKKYSGGTTYDVNSLYPSMMHSISGNYHPTGEPHWWRGNYVDIAALSKTRYYFIRIVTKFRIKDGYLPCIQIKNNLGYIATEWLTTSDIYNPADGKYYDKYEDLSGEIVDSRVQLTLTMTDYELIKEHYDLYETEILDGCWFEAKRGIFDKYIDKYMEIKANSEGAVREEAKLFLNNLYGKMAASTVSTFKVAYKKEDGVIGFYTVIANDKEPGYIPVGSAITSYSRNFTIRAAQQNYHGVNDPGFIYADTDSIHCDLGKSEIKGIKEHNSKLCTWKCESEWEEGWFVRQKTYFEREKKVTLKCAGMPESCKKLLLHSMGYKQWDKNELSKLGEDETEFISVNRTIEDFRPGLKIPGKLLPKRMKSGILLTKTDFMLREKKYLPA